MTNELGPHGKLLAYSLGTLSGDERTALEDRLLDSPALLMEFFIVKRSLEDAEGELLKPSAAFRTRLRADIARAVGPKRQLIGNWKSWTLVASAAAAALAAVVWIESPFHRDDTRKPDPSAGVNKWSLDSAGSGAVSLNYL